MTRSGGWVAAAIPAVAILAAVSCSDGTSPNKTSFGPVVAMGNGTAQSYVELTSDGAPVSVGVIISETALTGLPAAGTAYVLALPADAPVAPYNHAVVNWNPDGHPPQGVFTVPHFDIHFYTITAEERAAILPSDPQFAAKTSRLPAADFVPPGYVNDPFAIPQMGVHWTDPSAPEFNGQPFTKEFIYGSWDGAFTFYEPMVAKSLLDSKPATSVTPIKVPSRYAKAGSYPSSYEVGYDSGAKTFRIGISGLR